MKTSLTLFVLASIATFAGILHATDLTWDADTLTTGAQDGIGIWDTTTNTWWDGANNAVWNSSTPDNAIIGAGNGAAGMISNAAPLTVGNITYNAAASGTYSNVAAAVNVLTLSNTIITNNANALLSVVLAGTAFIKEGPAQLSLRPGANNTFTGTVIVNNGTLALNSSAGSRILIPGDLVINSGTTVTNPGSSGPVADTATVTVNTNGTYASGSDIIGTLVLNGGTVIQNSADQLTTTSSIDARDGSVLQSSGATGKLDGNLTKTTTGTVLITSRGSNSASGLVVTVNNGSLILDYTQTQSKLADGGILTVNGGTLIFTNYTSAETVGSVILTNGMITNTSGTTDLRVPSGGNFDVRSGEAAIILGAGAGRTLTKSTAGTVILSADNSYSGGTLISAGVLQIGNGGATGLPGSVSAGITNNGTLVYNRSVSPANISAVISGSGSLVNIGSSTVPLTGANTYSGSTTCSNGTITVSSTSTLGDGTGTLNLSGGTFATTASRLVSTAPVANPVNLTADSVIATTSISSSVDLNFTNDSIGGSSGTLTFRNIGADGAADQFEPRFSGSFTFNRPIVIDNGPVGKTRLSSFNAAATTQTFNGIISGNGAFRRSVSAGVGGVTVFNATNTYSGDTAINAGTLLVNGAIGTGNVTITSGGVLGGNGTVNGPVTVQSGGTVSAGTSIGILTISNSLTFLANSTNYVELNKSSLTNDLVRGITTVTYAGTLVVANLAGSLALNDTFKIFDATTYTGSFTATNLPTLTGSLIWDTTGLTNNGTIKVVSSTVAPPQIGSVSIQGTNVILSGSGGTEGSDYWVLTSTNIAQPVTNWTSIATNQFITGGNFNFTNGIDPTIRNLFYILQVP